MKAGLQRLAAELGFDVCRVTSAAAPEAAGHFQRWLAEGRHGEMAYLARNADRRVDLQRVLPGARSVVTLAVSYGAAAASPPVGRAMAASLAGRGIIARYARYADYHDVLVAPLERLTAFLDGMGGPGTCSRWYVDTGPVLERDLAQRAGVGFIGKHTNLISRELGNWFLLAEILTTAVLPSDAPEVNRCGRCTRCIAACPTAAIVAPFQLDARRCISYLTIELKGAIPVELRPAIGRRIFGCDDCLAACPWNRFARQGRLMAAHVRADLAEPDLLELLALDRSGFKARFAGTPILRTKRRGLLRNVCVALGNDGDASVRPALERAAHDPEPLIAEHATWALQALDARSKPPGARV